MIRTFQKICNTSICLDLLKRCRNGGKTSRLPAGDWIAKQTLLGGGARSSAREAKSAGADGRINSIQFNLFLLDVVT